MKNVSLPEEARRHPGLQLDRLSPPAPQDAQRRHLDRIVGAQGDPELLSRLLVRRARILSKLGARPWTSHTTGPLTLHLARRSALENVGLALHPTYGFAYLPGTGLKGLAKAWATTVWRSTHPDQVEAVTALAHVFGWQVGSREDNLWADTDSTEKNERLAKVLSQDRAGGVVFHEAWPETWPRLIVDTTTNHHRDYYGSNDKQPPGDWEAPVPISFLTVPPGQRFSCALSFNGKGDDRLLDLAQQWLVDALAWLGAGAKTNAGYGSIEPVPGAVVTVSAAVPATRKTFETTLTLVTPAFLAGATQTREDCDLRPATLRGLLRQWWRTRHVGFLDVETLARLEATVWGSTDSPGAVRVTVTPAQVHEPIPFDEYKDGFRIKNSERTAHLDKRQGKVTPGLFYLAYGMADGGKPPRWHAQPGSSWRVQFVTRDSQFPADAKSDGDSTGVSADMVLDEAKAALWLLSRYGGVGAKNRKGFGSVGLAANIGLNLDVVKTSARALRETCRIGAEFDEHHVYSPTLEDGWMHVAEIPTAWADPVYALHELGHAVQAFASSPGNKHREHKAALGLPRQIDGPLRSSTPPPRKLTTLIPGKTLPVERYAAPVFYHLDRETNGTLTIRLTTFDSRHLRTLTESRRVLADLSTSVETELKTRAAKPHPAPQARGGIQPALRTSAAPSVKTGARVLCRLLDQRTNSGGWKAEHVDTRMPGHVLNWTDVPGDKKPGDEVSLVVHAVNTGQRTLVFKWPK